MLRGLNDIALLREWTVQSLIVVRTHLVLVSVKLVLQKTCLVIYRPRLVSGSKIKSKSSRAK